MRVGTLSILMVTTVMTGLAVQPASAAGLLSGLLGGGGDGGGVNTGNTVDVKSGPAGSDALANVGIGNGGGDNNNIADVNIGGNNDGPNASASVRGGLLGNGGLLGTGLGEGGSGLGGSDGFVAGLDLGGLGLGLGGDGNDVTIGIGGSGGGGTGGDGGSGGPGTGGPGGTGTLPGGAGGFGGGGNGGGGTLSASLGGAANCSLAEGRQVLQTAAGVDVSRSAIRGWQRAYNVQVIPVHLCASTRAKVARILDQSGKMQVLHNAAASDMLVSASLSRSRHDAGDVFAVQRRGGQLVVYVF